jgi:cobalt/nickel transport system permease protein
MATVIIAQALFMQDGGLVALGANIFNIGTVTCLSGYAVFKLLGGSADSGKRLLWAGFFAGWFSLMISAACCALEMGLSGAIPLRAGLTTMLGYHAIVGIVEGTLTAGVLSFLKKVRPDLMELEGSRKFGLTGWIGAILFVAIPLGILIAAGSSSFPDPLQKLLETSSVLQNGAAGGENIFSSARYLESIIKAIIFLLLVSLAVLINWIARRRKSGL